LRLDPNAVQVPEIRHCSLVAVLGARELAQERFFGEPVMPDIVEQWRDYTPARSPRGRSGA
jgi:hypothetical protein